MANPFLNEAVKILEEGDIAINFVSVDQNYRKTSLKDLINSGPILLFTSWSRESGIQDQYFESFKKFEQRLICKGHKIVFVTPSNYMRNKEDQEKYNCENCIFLDDVSQNRFQISNTYFGDSPARVRNFCCLITPDGLIKYKQQYPEVYNFDFFFDIVSQYIEKEG